MRNKLLAFFFFVCGWNLISAQSLNTHPFLDETMVSWRQFSVEETVKRHIICSLNIYTYNSLLMKIVLLTVQSYPVYKSRTRTLNYVTKTYM